MSINHSYLPISDVIKSVSVTHKFDKPKLIFLNTSDVEAGKIINKKYFKISNLKGQAKKTIKKNDILFSEIRPKNKRYAYVDIDDTDDYVVSTKLMVLRKFNDKVDNKYLYYFLTSEQMLSVLQSRAENRIGSFPQITFELLSEYHIRVPELRDQQKISGLLSDIDLKIELNNKINTELEALAKFIYDFWFIQFDFPDQNGKPYKSSGGKMIWNEELKREIPEGWKSTTLSKIANITMGQSPPGSSYNEDEIGIIFYQGSTDFGNRYPIIRQYTSSPSRLAKLGDILLSVRAPVGDMNIANHDCCIGRGLAALNSKIGAQGFLYEVMKYFKQIFDLRNGNGTTFGSITKDDLYSLPLAYPSDDLVMNFEEIVLPMYMKQNLIETENQKLIELRDWLLPMLMNGQVKFKEN